MKSLKKLLFLPIVLIIGCGGSGGSGGTDTPVQNTPPTVNNGIGSEIGTIYGYLVDSPIAYMDYTSPSISDQTDGFGFFQCVAGEDVTFTIGGLSIGSSPCLPLVSPIEIVTNGRVKYDQVSFTGSDVNELAPNENSRLHRLLMLLQTLDEDGDVSNGIEISPQLSTALTSLEVDQSDINSLLSNEPISSFGDSMDLLASTLGGQSVSVRDITQATNHFKSTLTALEPCTSKFGATSVMGTTDNCVALSCDTTSTFLQNGSCQPMQSCSVLNIPNSTAVTGYVNNNTCAPTSCSPGFNVEGGACVPSQANTVIVDMAANYLTTNLATFLSVTMSSMDCTHADSFETMRLLYQDRHLNNFLSDPAYINEQSCLDYMVLSSVVESRVSLGREGDILELTGALESGPEYFNANGSINQYEAIILDMLFDAL